MLDIQLLLFYSCHVTLQPKKTCQRTCRGSKIPQTLCEYLPFNISAVGSVFSAAFKQFRAALMPVQV